MCENIEPTQPLITAEFSGNVEEVTDDLDDNILSLHRKRPVSF